MGPSHYLQVTAKKAYDSGQQATEQLLNSEFLWSGVNQVNHFDDCYFCMTNLVGYVKRTEITFLIHQFLQLHDQFLILTKTQCVPVFKKLLDIPISAASLAPEPVPEELTESDSDPESLDNDNDIDYHECSSDPNRFNQDDLSDLICDLNLPKEIAELLASHLKDRNILQTKTNVTFYRNREGNFLPYFK